MRKMQDELKRIIDEMFEHSSFNAEAAKNYSEGLVDGVKLANYFDENLSYEEREWLLEYIIAVAHSAILALNLKKHIDKTNEKEKENDTKG